MTKILIKNAIATATPQEFNSLLSVKHYLEGAAGQCVIGLMSGDCNDPKAALNYFFPLRMKSFAGLRLASVGVKMAALPPLKSVGYMAGVLKTYRGLMRSFM